MRILHLPYTYFPAPSGGTEVYVADLARELARGGISSVIGFASPLEPSSYEWEGVAVRRVEVPEPASLHEYHGQGLPLALAAYARLVAEVGPDVVHVHAYTPALNGGVVAAIRGTGVPVVTTYHTPTVTCHRGTLLRFGHVVCDGVMLVDRCSACVLQKNRIPRPFADLLGHLPVSLARAIASTGRQGGVWTALRMPELMEMRHHDARLFLDSADVIVAPASWVRATLIANGVASAKIVLSPQGVGTASRPGEASRLPSLSGGPLRAVMLGRLDRTKGAHILLEALAHVPSLPIELDIFGTDQGNDAYVNELRRAVGRDPRVRLLPPLARAEVPNALTGYDVMLVPSQWLETGPLVVLEAQGAQLPVIGSALGGIADRVRSGVDGLLVEPQDSKAWARALEMVTRDRSVLSRWRAAISPPRTMAAVADDMSAIYGRLSARALSGRQS